MGTVTDKQTIHSPGCDVGSYCFLENTDKSKVDIPNVSYHVYIRSLSTDFHIRRWRGVGGDVIAIRQSGQMSHTAGYFEGHLRTCSDSFCADQNQFFKGSQTIFIHHHWNQNMHFKPNYDFPSLSLYPHQKSRAIKLKQSVHFGTWSFESSLCAPFL